MLFLRSKLDDFKPVLLAENSPLATSDPQEPVIMHIKHTHQEENSDQNISMLLLLLAQELSLQFLGRDPGFVREHAFLSLHL